MLISKVMTKIKQYIIKNLVKQLRFMYFTDVNDTSVKIRKILKYPFWDCLMAFDHIYFVMPRCTQIHTHTDTHTLPLFILSSALYIFLSLFFFNIFLQFACVYSFSHISTKFLMVMARILHRGSQFHSEPFYEILWTWAFMASMTGVRS